MAYCEVQDVLDRLSQVGVLYQTDDDDDGSYSTSDADLIETCIAEAAVEIDAALAPWFDTPRSTAGNAWLNVRCLDLASERLCERKGQTAPVSIAAAAERSRAWLELVRRGKESDVGMRVPGLEYPGDSDTITAAEQGRPRVVNHRR